MFQLTRRPEPVELEFVTPEIQRFSGQYSYGELVGNYLVRDGADRILIEAPAYSESTHALFTEAGTRATIFLTHAATSMGSEQWQERASVPVLLNHLDLRDEWLRVQPSATFHGDFQITTHLRALHLPDHSAGHTVFFDNRHGGTLFSGDAILLKNGKIKFDLAPEMRAKIFGLQFERLLPLHYTPILRSASAFVHAALLRE